MVSLVNRLKKLEQQITPKNNWCKPDHRMTDQLSDDEWAEAIEILIQCGVVYR